MQRLCCWIFIALSLTACHVKTFFTTNPFYYSDLIPDVREDWEGWAWQQSEQALIDSVGEETVRTLCPESMAIDRPKTTAVHAFNYNGARAMYNASHDLVIYPIGDIEALFHEYVHARMARTSDKCKSELIATNLTKEVKIPSLK